LKVVDAVADALSLKNICTEHIRAEEIRGRKFDVAISRAVAPLKDLWHWARPLLKPQNIYPTEINTLPNASGLICLKGGDLAAEISESGRRPRMYDIYDLFPEESLREKYILQVPYERIVNS
jgi:16S rRNA (guanine527-N7)-methyltransferase